MIKRKAIITNSQGLHMRAAGLIAKEMGKFESNVYICYNGSKVNAKSILNIITACIKCGSEIEIECDGSDERDAMEKAVEIIESSLSSQVSADNFQKFV